MEVFMVCKSNAFNGTLIKNKKWMNFSENVTFSAEEYFEPQHTSPGGPPDGLQQLVHVVARATNEQKALHAIGSGWAYESLAQSDSWVVNLKNLNRRLHNVIPTALTDGWKEKQGNAAATTHLVHVEAGMKIIDLIEMLEGVGLAMPTLGGANGQNLAGAISTSTHGGDWNQPPLPDVVRGIHLVTDGGRELWIERASEPITTDVRLKPVLTCPDTEIIRNDSIFDAALVSFGRFGVIYAFVLEVRKEFRVVEVATTADDDELGELLLALMAGMTSPNDPFEKLFSRLRAAPLPPGLAETVELARPENKPYFFQFVWSSAAPSSLNPFHTPQDTTYVQRRWITSVSDNLNSPNDLMTEMINGLLSAIPDGLATPAGEIFVAGGGLRHLATKALEEKYNDAVKEGLRASHHLLTSGTRKASENIPYNGDYIEIIFDAQDDRIVPFLGTIRESRSAYDTLGWISLRPSRASRAFLSMHNVASSYAISIEVALLKGPMGNEGFLNFIHETALKYGGRPHWGQKNNLNNHQVVSLYGVQLKNWRTALTQLSASSTLFSNNFTQQRDLEPTNIELKVTALSPSKNELVVVGLRKGNDKYNYEVQFSQWASPLVVPLQQSESHLPVHSGHGLIRPVQKTKGWNGWQPLKPASGLPDNFIGSAVEGGKAYVFWIASDGWVNYRVRGQDGHWARYWLPVGNTNARPWNGVPGGAVHAVSCQPGTLHVFYTDRQGGILAVRGNTTSAPGWPHSQWIKGCKTIAGGHVTAVSRCQGQVDAFVVGTDGRVYTAAWNAQDDWSNWRVVKEGLIAKPGSYISAVSRNINLLDIFVADEGGKTMSAAWAPPSGWNGWWHIQGGISRPGGYVTGISRSSDKLDIFTTDPDQRILTAAWDPGVGWAGWWPIGNAKAQSLVWPVSRSQDKIDLFFVDPDGSVQTSAWAPGHPWDGPWSIS